MKEQKSPKAKKPYAKPELKAVKVRPREVLGSSCHNSTNSAAIYDCGIGGCAY